MSTDRMYDVILADPPWEYRKGKHTRGNATNHYDTMSIDELCDVNVKALSADNCALFLWAVWPSLFNNVPRLLDSWGFEYKTIAWVWVKLNPSSIGFHMGTGHYTRANSEPCLLAVKGSMLPQATNVHSLIVSPVSSHSKKPEEQYGKIESLYPGARRIELFARRPYTGWDVLGNEVGEGLDINKSIDKLLGGKL